MGWAWDTSLKETVSQETSCFFYAISNWYNFESVLKWYGGQRVTKELRVWISFTKNNIKIVMVKRWLTNISRLFLENDNDKTFCTSKRQNGDGLATAGKSLLNFKDFIYSFFKLATIWLRLQTVANRGDDLTVARLSSSFVIF